VDIGDAVFWILAEWFAVGDGDLHVQTPNNEHIYWGNPIDSTGGILDVNSNIIGPESVIWPPNTTPTTGLYHVCFDNRDNSLGVGANYVIYFSDHGSAGLAFNGVSPIQSSDPTADCNPSNPIYVTSFYYYP